MSASWTARLTGHLVTLLFLGATAATAAPIAVRFSESVARGFLALRDESGKTLARGELIQTPGADRVESRLVFRFADGSVSDETVVFSQARVFRLLSYRIVQRGPAFPESLEASLVRESGRYAARTQTQGGGANDANGTMDVPEDLYNGMLGLLVRNLAPGQKATVRLVAFTPKPRILDVPLAVSGQRPVVVGGLTREATVFAVQPELRGVAKVIAPFVGKRPPILRYSILPGEVPAFLRFEGAFFAGGPTWRVELAAPEWPSASRVPGR